MVWWMMVCGLAAMGAGALCGAAREWRALQFERDMMEAGYQKLPDAGDMEAAPWFKDLSVSSQERIRAAREACGVSIPARDVWAYPPFGDIYFGDEFALSDRQRLAAGYTYTSKDFPDKFSGGFIVEPQTGRKYLRDPIPRTSWSARVLPVIIRKGAVSHGGRLEYVGGPRSEVH